MSKFDAKVFTSYTMGGAETKGYKRNRKSRIARSMMADERSDEEEARQKEQAEAAKKRKPLVDAYETPKSTFEEANAVFAGIVNFKMEFAEATADKDAKRMRAKAEPGTALAGGARIKISSL